MDRLGTSHGEARVKGAIHLCTINTCRLWCILLLDPRCEHSSAPTVDFTHRRAQGLVKAGRVFRGHPKGVALTDPSTAACLIGSGLKASGTCAGTNSFIPVSGGRHSYAEPQAEVRG